MQLYLYAQDIIIVILSLLHTHAIPAVGCPCMISLTFNGEILVHSLPSLRPVAMIPYGPLHDLRYVHTCIVASARMYVYEQPSSVTAGLI